MRLTLPIVLSALISAPLIAAPPAGATGRDSLSVPKDTRVTLVSPGQGPRKQLRYRFRAGDAVTLTMDMSMKMGMEILGRVVPPQTMPTMRMEMGLRVARVTPGGESTLALVLNDVRLIGTAGFTAAQQQQLLAAIKPLKGFRATLVVTSRGVTKGMTYTVPPGVPAAAQQILQNLSHQMKQLSTPLPVEAVGVGATWRVVIPLKGPPITLATQLDFRLEAFTTDGVRLKVKVAGWAPSQPMGVPGMRGVSAHLKSLQVTGSGRLALSFARPASSGRMSAKQIFEASFSMGAGSQAMKMLMDMDVEIRSR